MFVETTSVRPYFLQSVSWYRRINGFWFVIKFDLCHKNQLDAIFSLSLFRQSTSTYFGHICSPSSGGILYGTTSSPTRPTDSQLESTARVNCCIYTVYLLMMG